MSHLAGRVVGDYKVFVAKKVAAVHAACVTPEEAVDLLFPDCSMIETILIVMRAFEMSLLDARVIVEPRYYELSVKTPREDS